MLHNIEFLCSYTVVDECFPQFFVSTSSNFCHLQNMSPLNILFFSLQVRSILPQFSFVFNFPNLCHHMRCRSDAEMPSSCFRTLTLLVERPWGLSKASLKKWLTFVWIWASNKGEKAKQSVPEKMNNIRLDLSLQLRRKCAAKNQTWSRLQAKKVPEFDNLTGNFVIWMTNKTSSEES